MTTSAIALTCLLVGQPTTDRYGESTRPQGAPATNSAVVDADGDNDPDDFGSALGEVDRDAPLPVTRPGGDSVATDSQFSFPPTSTSPADRLEDLRPGSPPTDPPTVNPPRGTSGSNSTRDLVGQESAASPSGIGNRGTKPTTLMRSMLAPPAGSQLTGQPVSLQQVVAGAPVRWQQSLRIDAYWDLCSAVADYYLRLSELEELRTCGSGITSPGADWRHAEVQLGARIDTARSAALSAQYRLASLMGRSAPNRLPLPADFPHCGDYYSRYEEVFRGRPSVEAKELAVLLPMRFQQLGFVASQVTDCQYVLQTVASTAQADNVDRIIDALTDLALQRRAFVRIAIDYNQRIARYVELATPGQVGTDQLVAMLIRSDRDDRPASLASRQPAGRQTTPQAPGQTRGDRPDVPNTFAGNQDWAPRGRPTESTVLRDESVVPASGLSRQTRRQEKSVLVNPPRDQ